MPAFERWSIVGCPLALASVASACTGRWLCSGTGHYGCCTLPCVWRFCPAALEIFGHMVYGSLSWASRSAILPGTLRVPQRAGQPPGAQRGGDFPWYDLLQADACTTCGRCNAVCPALAAGKALRPREVVLGLRAAFDAGGMRR